MNIMTRRRSDRLLACVGATALTLAVIGMNAPASAKVGPRTAAQYRYEVRAMGAKVGHATLSIGLYELVDNRVLRPVTLEAKTTGLGRSVYASSTRSTSWVDDGWRPWKSAWDATTPKGKQNLQADYRHSRGKSLAKGLYKRTGKQAYPTAFRTKMQPTDLVSFFAMLPHKKALAPGDKLTMPLYDGWRLFDLTATVGQGVMIKVPARGKRLALPVKVVAKHGKITRNVIYWIDAQTQEPLKLTFKFGMLGAVEAVLTKVDQTSI